MLQDVSCKVFYEVGANLPILSWRQRARQEHRCAHSLYPLAAQTWAAPRVQRAFCPGLDAAIVIFKCRSDSETLKDLRALPSWPKAGWDLYCLFWRLPKLPIQNKPEVYINFGKWSDIFQKGDWITLNPILHGAHFSFDVMLIWFKILANSILLLD